METERERKPGPRVPGFTFVSKRVIIFVNLALLKKAVFMRWQSGEMLFGAPGTYNWRGNLFSNILDHGLHSIARWRQSAVEDALAGTDMPPPATSYYSYLGD